jgi:hypothetical protein
MRRLQARFKGTLGLPARRQGPGDSRAASHSCTNGIGLLASTESVWSHDAPFAFTSRQEDQMSNARMIRDWAYVAVLAVLLVSYAASLVSQAVSARAAESAGACVLTSNSPSAT